MINLQQNIDLTLYERVAKSERYPDGIRPLGKDVLHKPTIIAIPSLDSYGSKDANGMAKRAQMLLGRIKTFSDELQIIGAHQSSSINMPRAVKYHNQAAAIHQHIYAPGLMQFVREQLQPLITKGTPPKKIGAETASRNLRNINFFTHSSGTVAVDEIGNALCDVMENAGYSEDEIRRITSQVTVVAIAGASGFGRSKASFTSINCMNLSDSLIAEFCDNVDRAKDIIKRADADLGGNTLHILPISYARKNEYLVATDAIGKRMPRAECDGKLVDKDSYIKKEVSDPSGHILQSYINYGIGAHGFILPQIISTVMTNAVNNSVANQKSKKFTPLNADELFNTPKKIHFKTSDADKAGIYADLVKLNEATRFSERVKKAKGETGRNL